MNKYIIEAECKRGGVKYINYFEVEAGSEEDALNIFDKWNVPYNGVSNEPCTIYFPFQISSKSYEEIVAEIKAGTLKEAPANMAIRTDKIRDLGVLYVFDN